MESCKRAHTIWACALSNPNNRTLLGLLNTHAQNVCARLQDSLKIPVVTKFNKILVSQQDRILHARSIPYFKYCNTYAVTIELVPVPNVFP